MEDKMIDQTQLAEDLSSKIKYEFRQMFLVKPLEPVKVKKKISEPVAKDTKPKKDKDGIEAVDYDEVKTEIKEVDSDFSRAVVLKLPYEYTHPYSDRKNTANAYQGWRHRYIQIIQRCYVFRFA